MNYDERNDQSPGYNRFMANLHLIMGVVFLFFGGLVFYTRSFGSMNLDTWQAYGMSALLILYGTFRIWRGIRDMQFRKRGR